MQFTIIITSLYHTQHYSREATSIFYKQNCSPCLAGTSRVGGKPRHANTGPMWLLFLLLTEITKPRTWTPLQTPLPPCFLPRAAMRLLRYLRGSPNQNTTGIASDDKRTERPGFFSPATGRVGALGCLLQLHCRAWQASGAAATMTAASARSSWYARARHHVHVRRVARERGGGGRGGAELDAAALALLIACSELNWPRQLRGNTRLRRPRRGGRHRKEAGRVVEPQHL